MAEQEGELEEQRPELRARLNAAGLRAVSSEELLSGVKRLSGTVDGYLQRKELMGLLEEAVLYICLPAELTGFEARIHPNFETTRDWNERDALTRELERLFQEVSKPADDIFRQGLGVAVPEKYGMIGKYVREIALHKTVPARERSIQVMPFGRAR